eukprot:75100_1
MMSTQEKTFQRIDNALAMYYHRLGQLNYINSVGNGKLLQFLINEELIDPDIPIENELLPTCSPNDCVYTGFVNANEFPVPIGVIIPNASKSAYVFHVMQYCWLYGYPPSDDYIQNVLVPHININRLLTQIYDQSMCYMIGFVSGWICITAVNLDYFIGFWLNVENDIIELEEGDALEIQSDWEEGDAFEIQSDWDEHVVM